MRATFWVSENKNCAPCVQATGGFGRVSRRRYFSAADIEQIRSGGYGMLELTYKVVCNLWRMQQDTDLSIRFAFRRVR